ncbi:DUF1648 domain-containing protein [Kitasatospora sp. NPDC059646]|uniref:DUF1648 domain-containing protein n=1 Tax=Kitasatospora sp. NPDC059646 TaxID=3346893 RepID=UPI0036CEC70A
MTDPARAPHTGRRLGAAWAVGLTALIAALPWTAAGRLPDRLATHWSGGGTPNGSMPLWAASVVPAALWAVLAGAVLLSVRRGGALAAGRAAPALLFGGVLLTGAQASVVRANVDREHWQQAHQPVGWVVGVVVAALLAGAVGVLLGRRHRPAAAPAGPAGPVLDLPEGERLVWFSHTANPWLLALAAGFGLAAVAAALALVGGLAPAGPGWTLLAVSTVVAVAGAVCSSVRARVSERGLEVAFGPFGRPVRRWAADEIESARAEHRTAAQVGGWGYRLSSLGTTVMLRGGECLVVRIRGRAAEFAVSVDDAERGAALLNALNSRRAH